MLEREAGFTSRSGSMDLDRVRVLEDRNKDLSREFDELKAELAFECRRREEAENRLSFHPVTGLPTHYQLDIELNRAVKAPGEPKLAVIIVQLGPAYDTIKRTFKSSVTEWILYQTSARFKETLGPEDSAFHTRENEFILLMRFSDSADLGSRMKKCLRRHHEPHIFSGFNLGIGGSAGVSLFPAQGRDKGRLLHQADIALGVALESGRNCVFYEEIHETTAIERMDIQASIVRAIEAPAAKKLGSQFVIHFQPKVSIRSVAGKKVMADSISAEALIRWNHPKRGMMAPDKFIAIAEETGLIMPMGKWIIFQVANRLSAWKKSGLPPVAVSINLSPRQFRSAEVIEVLQHLVKAESLDPGLVTIEVTETSLIENPASALGIIERLKGMGFRLSVDDFGTGYSSLSHLHRYPIDEIKIDRSFIRHFPQNPRDLAIVESLVKLSPRESSASSRWKGSRPWAAACRATSSPRPFPRENSWIGCATCAARGWP
jgi:predicted signal transduction protein with EAL and GGDEF domain